MSSRNNLLSDEQKEQAKLVPKFFHSGLPCQHIKELLIKAGFVVDYVEEYDNRRFAAVRIGKVRLIDNVYLTQMSFRD
jgi:pantoate--beta-alanine ligase